MTAMLALLAVLAQGQTPRDARGIASGGTATLAGVVVGDDAQARPLRRARVTLNGGGIIRTVITADDGTFTARGLAPGKYELSAGKPAYVTTAYGASRAGLRGRPVTIAAGETARVTIRLARGAVITGTVLDAVGDPVQGVDVAVEQRRYVFGSYRYVSVGSPAAPTDDRGVYRVYGLPAGTYFVCAQPKTTERMRRLGPGSRTLAPAQVFYPSAVDPTRAARVSVRPGEERSGVDVQLQYVPVASVSGTVAIPAGWDPAEVSLGPIDESSGPAGIFAGTRTDVAGRFSFASVIPGSYRLVARTRSGRGVLIGAADITVNGEDVDDVSPAMQPPLTVTGLIVFRGDSPPPPLGTSTDMRPLAILPNNPDSVAPLLVLDGFRFGLTGVAPGPFRLTSSMQGVRSPLGKWWMTSIVVNGVDLLDGAEIRDSVDTAVATFSDRVSEISGVVTSGGVPLSDASVIAIGVDRASWFIGSRRVADARTNGEGRYTIRNLPPGDYRVVATTDLDRGEWFEPGVLERLAASGAAVSIKGPDTVTLDLRTR